METPNNISHQPPDEPWNDERLMQLVDGELSDAERRKLLESLDTAPEGWQRCALAFLEDQAFREAIGSDVPPPRQAKPRPSVRLPENRRRGMRPWHTAMAMAASFLLALVVSRSFLTPSPSTLSPAPPRVADAEQPPADTAGNVAEDAMEASPSTWQNVMVAVDRGDRQREFAIPATECDRVDAKWLDSRPNMVPAHIVDAFRRSGHRIQHVRRAIPVRIDDGRVLVVPVDDVEVRYDVNPAYH